MTKKKIALVSAVFAPTQGGMATAATAEAIALPDFFDVTVFTLAGGDLGDVPFALRRLRGFPRISLGGFVPQLFWYLRDFDVVYAQLPAYGFLVPLIFWKLIFRGRLVVTLHMDPVGTGWRNIIFACERLFLRAAVRMADIVRVSSDALATNSLIGPSQQIRVIPFGVHQKFFSVPKKWGNDITFLFVGRLATTHYFKGVPILLEAFAACVTAGHNCFLRIVGDGDLRASFELRAKELAIADRVTFLGSISDELLVQEYQNAHALVLPSTDSSETFGLVLLEALACGTPIIVSDLPGTSTVMQGFSVGKLVPPGDAGALAQVLESFIIDQPWWIRAAEHAPAAAAAQGNWKKVAERLVNLL